MDGCGTSNSRATEQQNERYRITIRNKNNRKKNVRITIRRFVYVNVFLVVGLRSRDCAFFVLSQFTQIVDVSTGDVLGPHQDGEICVKGPTVMKGNTNQC